MNISKSRVCSEFPSSFLPLMLVPRGRDGIDIVTLGIFDKVYYPCVVCCSALSLLYVYGLLHIGFGVLRLPLVTRLPWIYPCYVTSLV
ncbi:hypothetical protein GDO81_009115 [Engystomops pustulosus]|uniref:Uncharacterized protein n=1 Tax=Engystomops pustulosus TaxID=76066 RepID=A0AAV7BP10_ENGPU|nr:hypothetical protein GDO81_009115 [Engystomops pustulosus]